MRFFRQFCAVLAAAFLAGCSIHPLPDDLYPGVPTEEIVRNLRCEVKDALRAEIHFALKYLDSETGGTQRLSRIAPEHILYPQNLVRVAKAYDPKDPSRGPRVAQKLMQYANMWIAFQVKFDVTEINKANASTNMLWPFFSGNLSLNASAGLDKTRQGVRTFATLQTFDEFRDLKCEGRVIHNQNIVYPIIGKIGMAKIIHTFIWLNEPGPPLGLPDVPPDVNSSYWESPPAFDSRALADDLSGVRRGSKAAIAAKLEIERLKSPLSEIDASKFVDKLIFTTKWTGGAKPSFVLGRMPDGFRIADASGELSASREDIHDLTISLTFPDRYVFQDASFASEQSVRRLIRRSRFAMLAAREQAALNLCVELARERENAFGSLRFTAPEQSCLNRHRLP